MDQNISIEYEGFFHKAPPLLKNDNEDEIKPISFVFFSAVKGIMKWGPPGERDGVSANKNKPGPIQRLGGTSQKKR
jgi:hypothetical protein